jgi:hypothetical protein
VETMGLSNQKPLTIKPYPMKIRNEYSAHIGTFTRSENFLMQRKGFLLAR